MGCSPHAVDLAAHLRWPDRTTRGVCHDHAHSSRGEWDRCRQTLLDAYDTAGDAEYLVVTGRKEF
jgi:hypothetical protein